MANVRISLENNKTVFVLPDESNLRIPYNTSDLEDYYDDEGVTFYHKISRRLRFGAEEQDKFLYAEVLDGNGNPVGDKAAVQSYLSDKTGFNRTSGGGAGRRTITPTESPFASTTARDTWAAANLNELHNSATQVTVVTVVGDAVYQWGGDDTPANYNNPIWTISARLNVLTGTLSTDRIPMAGANGTLVDSSFQEFAEFMQSDKTLIVPQQSLQIGYSSVMSAFGAIPQIESFISGRHIIFPFTYISKTGGSERTREVGLLPFDTVTVQGVDSEIVSNSGSLTFTATTSESITDLFFRLQAGTGVTGFRFRARIQGRTEPFYYFPTRADFNAGRGEDFPDSGNTPNEIRLDIFEAPITVFENQVIEVDYEVDTGVVMGDSNGIPYLRVDRNVIALRDLAYLSEINQANVDPSVHNLTIDIASRVDLNTNLNGVHKISYDVTNRNTINSLQLIVTDGDNVTITNPTSDGRHTASVTLSGIDTSTQGTVTFQLRATETDGTIHNSNTVTINVRNLAVHEQTHFGFIISTDSASDIDFSTDDISVSENAIGSYTVLGIPNDSNLYRIYFAVPTTETNLTRILQLNFDLTSQFTQTTENLNGVNYNVWLLNQNSAVNSNYNTQILNTV